MVCSKNGTKKNNNFFMENIMINHLIFVCFFVMQMIAGNLPALPGFLLATKLRT